LHGTGGDEKDLLPLAREFGPGINILSLRGNVTEGGMPRFFKRLGMVSLMSRTCSSGPTSWWLLSGSWPLKRNSMPANHRPGIFQWGQHRGQHADPSSRFFGGGHFIPAHAAFKIIGVE